MTLRIGSLCSGYEGLGMAVQSVLGGELAWVADNDLGASAILAHRYPGVPNLDDITAVDWSAVEPVDILCAGTPCQDVSQAGARAGLKAGTRSGVWLEAVRAIAVLQPRLVLIENVRGLLSARGDDPTAEHLRAEAARDVTVRLLDWLENEQAIALAKGDVRRVRECRKRTARVMGLRKRAVARCQWHERRLVRAIGTVLGSLARLGFDAEGVVVSAAEAGAPHQRDRVFILAWPAADTCGRELQRRGVTRVLGSAPAGEPRQGDQRERAGNAAGNGGPVAEDADGAASGERRQPAPGETEGGRSRTDAGRRDRASAADTERNRHGRSPQGAGEADALGAGSRTAAAGCGADIAANAIGAELARKCEPERREPASAGSSADPLADADLPGREGGEPARRQLVPARGAAADPDGRGRRVDGRSGRQGGQGEQLGLRPAEHEPGDIAWGPYELAIRRWERAAGRPAPRPTEPGRTGERLSPAFVEWMQGLPEGWVTDVPGLSRNQMLKALGNGVVPQQAAMALRLLMARMPSLELEEVPYGRTA